MSDGYDGCKPINHSAPKSYAELDDTHGEGWPISILSSLFC